MFKNNLDFSKTGLKNGERLEDLGDDHYIIQKENGFRFGMDAVLLADYASNMMGSKSKVCEIGTGSGIIPILLAKRTNFKSLIAYEIQEEMAEMATRSVGLNNYEEKIKIINKDLREVEDLPANSLDVIVTNPPYSPIYDSKKNPTRKTINPNLNQAISRHEISLNLDDIFSFSFKHLKQGGKLIMIHRPERLGEIIRRASEHRITVKKARFVHPRINSKAVMVLLVFSKDGKESMITEEPLIIYDGDNYSQEISEIYERQIKQREVVNPVQEE